MKIGYVASRYPDVSHTFIRREVESLIADGVDVTTFTVRRSERAEHFGPADRVADSTTTSILPISALALARFQLAALVRSPSAYLSTFVATMRSAPIGLRSWIWAVFHFLEGIVLWNHCRRMGIRHLLADFAIVGADGCGVVARFGGASDGPEEWAWSFSMHGSTEFYNVRAFDLEGKVDDADGIVCISDFARTQIMMHGRAGTEERVAIVHCGVDLTEYAPGPPEEGDHPLRVLFLGRLVVEKGPVVLVEAIGLLAASGVDVHLTMAGDGPARPAVEALIRRLGLEDRVELLGTVPPNETRDLYRSADVFCLPSFAEGLPVVLMEALACSVPVVTTYITGIPELVTDGVNGYMVTPGRADLVAEALRSLTDPGRRAEMGVAGRRSVEREFDITTIGAKLRTFFARMPGARDGDPVRESAASG